MAPTPLLGNKTQSPARNQNKPNKGDDDSETIRDTANGGVVLRSSCDTCAEVKMACSKDKPTCARCARRGEVCVYGPVRRAGRKKGRPSHRQPQNDRQRRRSSQDAAAQTRRSTVDSLTSSSPGQTWDLFMPDVTFGSNDLGNPFSSANAPTDSFSPFSLGQSSTPSGMANLLALPNETDNTLGLGDGNISSDTSWSGVGSGSSNNTVYSFTPPDLDQMDWMVLMNPTSPLGEGQVGLPQRNSEDFTVAKSNAFESLCPSSSSSPTANCPTQALAVLGALTSPMEACSVAPGIATGNVCGGQVNNAGATSSSTSLGFQDVMEKVDSSMDTVNSVFDCSCSKDSSLLLTLSHIAFRIMVWYAACARVPYAGSSCLPLGQQTFMPMVRPPTALPGYDLSEEPAQDRASCQIVLSKMHAVRTFVDRLSEMLLGIKNKEDLTYHPIQGCDSARMDRTRTSDLAITLEAELRSCLRDVTQATMMKLADV